MLAPAYTKQFERDAKRMSPLNMIVHHLAPAGKSRRHNGFSQHVNSAERIKQAIPFNIREAANPWIRARLR
jgi:hypothetical protein